MRFQGFEGEWETKKLGQIATNKSKIYNPKNETKFIKCIELEHLSSETGQLLGFTDGSKSGSIKKAFQKGDVLFGKLRPYLKKYHHPIFEGVCSSEIWVLSGTEILNDFLYYLIQTNEFIDLANQSSGSKMPRADWNILKNGLFSTPNSEEEQQKIALFLSLIEERIQTQSKIISELKSLMHSLREKIFRQKMRLQNKGESEFSNWKIMKLGTVTYKVDKNNKGGTNLPIYSVSNTSGFIPQSEQFDGIDSAGRGYDISLYKVIGKRTFVYNPARINVGSIGYSGDIENVIVSSLYVSLKTNDSVNDGFFKYFLQTEHFNNSVLRMSEGGVRVYLFYENFSEITIELPSYEEQVEIGNGLSAISEKIETEKKILEQYERQKKYLLQNMLI